MTIHVYDKTMERIGALENWASLQWLALYRDAGEAKLVCSATDANLRLLADGNRIWCDEQPESAVIRQVEIDDNGRDPKMTVRAVFSAARWSGRVVMATRKIGNAEAGMLALAEDNRRGLPGQTAPAKGLPGRLDTQVTWGSVLDGEKKLAAASALGFRERFDPYTGKESFEVYAGVDRTDATGNAYNGYFGDDIRNLESVKIVGGTADWKNRAIVAGQGEGDLRRVVTVDLAAGTGDDLREAYVDAKDISRSWQEAIPDENGGYTYEERNYSDTEYDALLRARGLEKLAEQLPRLEVSAELGEGVLRYGADYALGDIVPVKHTRYGLLLAARVCSVRTIYEYGVRRVTAVLGDYKIIKEALKL